MRPEHGAGKGKRLLFVDDKVPHFDVAAGARTSFMYLQLLVELGFDVTFLGADFRRVEPYSGALRALGVKSLDGYFYWRFWRLWLLANLRRYDYVFCNRPAPTQLLIGTLKRFGSATILYQCHDLHYLRWQRSYAYDRQPESLRKAQAFEKVERHIFEIADILLTFSEFEKQILTEDYPRKRVEVVPLFFYREFPRPRNDFYDCKGILFVGGFSHTPNVDAVEWFVREIFPGVAARIPDVVFYVVGSNPPPQIQAMECERVRILGGIDDRQLRKLYDGVRLVIVPLRFGAGVKGKVIEALHRGVPLVSTSIGLEGIPEIGTFLAGVDSAHDFGDRVVKLYADPAALLNLSASMNEYAKNHLSEETTKAQIRTLLKI